MPETVLLTGAGGFIGRHLHGPLAAAGLRVRCLTRRPEAAGAAGVRRLVYLGGVAPQGEPSAHLRARLATGELLRAGPVPCLELRAGMIVGAGSASWTIVRDLAARLPAMVLPAWRAHRSEPVAVDDVVAALVAGARREPAPRSCGAWPSSWGAPRSSCACRSSRRASPPTGSGSSPGPTSGWPASWWRG